MDNIKSFFSNKFVLAGIGATGAILLWKKFPKNPQKEEEERVSPLLSPLIQGCVFGLTSAVWFLQLNPNLFPQGSKFISKTLCSLYPLLPSFLIDPTVLNKINKNIFATKKHGLITAGVSMCLLTAYRKNNSFKSIINKLLFNSVTHRTCEIIGYSMPWIIMIKSAKKK
eukprot:402125_1